MNFQPHVNIRFVTFNVKLFNISVFILVNLSVTKERLWRISIFMDAWGKIKKKDKETLIVSHHARLFPQTGFFNKERRESNQEIFYAIYCAEPNKILWPKKEVLLAFIHAYIHKNTLCTILNNHIWEDACVYVPVA